MKEDWPVGSFCKEGYTRANGVVLLRCYIYRKSAQSGQNLLEGNVLLSNVPSIRYVSQARQNEDLVTRID
jgi:hypothetical protein